MAPTFIVSFGFAILMNNDPGSPSTLFLYVSEITARCDNGPPGSSSMVKFCIVPGFMVYRFCKQASSQEEEIRLAKILQKQGILFQVDWMHNTGGVIAGMEEYINGEKASMENIMEHTKKGCKYGTRRNLDTAKAEGITPTEMAYKYYSSKIYQ